MTGASKTFPPGEAPAAEARAEAALERELAPDAAPLDISLDEAPAEPGRLARGAEAIREFWRHAPLGPGVYRMIGAEGEVLYVGKARSIKKRIAAYMAPERQPTRIARMVAQTRSMVFVTTESDAEALLLEANLIKQLKPRYNVTLRDDKSFPYILICTGHPAARLIKHRGARTPAPAIISARSPAPARCFAPSTRCSGRFSCAPARTVFTPIEPGPACSIRSSAARRPAPARSRSTITPKLVCGGARFPLRPQPRDQAAASPPR